MGAVHIVDKLEGFPGRTPLLGETKGPVAFVGEIADGVLVFLSERESAEVTRAWGGKTKAEVEELEEKLDQALAQVAELEAELEWQRPLVEACDSVYRKLRAARPTVPA